MQAPDIRQLTALAEEFTRSSPLNRVEQAVALREDLAGMEMYQPPILGVARADDPLFDTLQNPGVVGPHFHPPLEWLPGANSVLSFFFPLTDRVVKGKPLRDRWPSYEWLHARIEGQAFIDATTLYLRDALTEMGWETVAPVADPAFRSWSHGHRPLEGDAEGPNFSSNWSERHVAHICGLGTFGLSKGIITSRGMAGRFCSLITAAELPTTPRNYTRYDEYCTYCGACVHRCPAQAITLEKGKDHLLCKGFLQQTENEHNPRYGCGMCQIKVPCQNRIPKAAAAAVQ